MEQPLEPGVTWQPCGDEQAAEALARLTDLAPEAFAGATLVAGACTDLPFYASYRLIDLEVKRDGTPDRAFVLHGPVHTRWLDGTSAPVHEANDDESLELTDESVLDYLRFFLFFVRGDSGAFVLLEDADNITLTGDDGAGAALQGSLAPLAIRDARDDADRWVVDGLVAYEDALFAATFAVAADGEVDMVDDEPLTALDGLSVTEPPSLQPATRRAPLLRDRDVTEAVVAVLLEDAIRERESDVAKRSLLLGHFKSVTQAGAVDQPIERLARLMAGSMPVVIIESDIPFVEEFVAGLVDGSSGQVTGGAIDRAGVVEGDELRCRVDYAGSATKLHLLSFHAYRSLFDAERTAHELALRDAAVLIGCDRTGDVPEPLYRIQDLALRFPRIDRRRFARIFERVFGTTPTSGWDAAGSDWTRYLVPTDFHIPRRLGVAADQALLMLHDRVETRLRQVTPDIGPSLGELHGLGEARQICEDLISDIRAAQAGRIPWAHVDKGVLLVGAPGTGKTTLARAVAKECGIKFVSVSAAAWQSAGALDAHLRAMRASFTEARRFAPAILFLDEIDSIGSRELLGGDHNVIYQTEVINSLLEQIQGILTVDPVIVIAATNYPERVDPALRRAGRLDQVVELPLPNIASLEHIFAYYLKALRADRQVGRDVKTRILAELAFGRTGADVEFFVRGAARRARRVNRKIKQEDLLAEITQRPRRPDSAPRLGPDEMRRVAVHEAGHAVALLTSSTQGNDLTFVTIIPRMDGSLGFVASVPRDGHVLTRRTLIEELETALAGRAAEELVFGAQYIGAGAGGATRSSDLAVATRLATLIVCQSGLGDDNALHWTETPTAAQETQIGALLGRAYGSVLARLQTHRPLLDQIIAVLEEKQELSGTELRRLAGANGAGSAQGADARTLETAAVRVP